MFVYRKEIVIILLLSVLNILRFHFHFVCVMFYLSCSHLHCASYSGGVNYLCGHTAAASVSVSVSFPSPSSSFCLSLFPRILSSSSVTNFCIFCHKFVWPQPTAVPVSHCSILLSCFRPCWLYFFSY